MHTAFIEDQFPAPTSGGLQPPVTPVQVNLTPIFGLSWAPTLTNLSPTHRTKNKVNFILKKYETQGHLLYRSKHYSVFFFFGIYISINS